MDLHMPGGSDWFSTIFSSDRDVHDMDEQAVATDVSSEEVVAALDAMREGHIEYVTLVDGDEFAQAAGEGDGPYVLEHWYDGRATVTVSNAPFDLVSKVLCKYHAGDASWRQDLGAPEETAAGSEAPVTEPKRGGFMSRLRGK